MANINIPDEVYERLKTEAERNRRSVDSEIIFRLEVSLPARRESAEEIIERTKSLHEGRGGRPITIEDIERAINEGHD